MWRNQKQWITNNVTVYCSLVFIVTLVCVPYGWLAPVSPSFSLSPCTQLIIWVCRRLTKAEVHDARAFSASDPFFCNSSYPAVRNASFTSDFSGTFTSAGLVILTANHVINDFSVCGSTSRARPATARQPCSTYSLIKFSHQVIQCLSFQLLFGNSSIILSTLQCFSTCKVKINALSSAVRWCMFIQVTSPMMQ